MKRNLFFKVLTLFVFGFALFTVDNQFRTVESQDFDVCLTDDNNGASLRFNSTSGDYMFCGGGKTFTGTGSVKKQDGTMSLQHSASDRRLSATVNTSGKNGAALMQSPVGKNVGAISDTNTANSSCKCR
jgi:hypothetical protein